MIEVGNPRRIINAPSGMRILCGGKLYLRDGKIKQSAVAIKTTITQALQDLEAHESQFDILPINGYW